MPKDNTTASISVVVPVYNEAGNIGPLASETIDALARFFNFEIIFVDDGSTDATTEEIRRAVKLSPFIAIRRHTRNRGQSAAVHTGVKAAKYNVIAVLDGDGQNDPKDIPNLFEALRKNPGTGLVIGERRKYRGPWVRRVASRMTNAVRSRLLRDGVSDTGCGVKVFHRDAYLQLPTFDHMHRFMPALFCHAGFGIGSVVVNHRARLKGESKYGVGDRLWVGIVDLLGVMWLQKRRI
mgnify:FL=1|jgi:dolichol-phosphate mannosyltransferase